MRPEPFHPNQLWALTVALFILVLSGCAGQGGGERQGSEERPDFGANSTFPVPPEIRDNVDFWRHVYGIWSRNQLVVHDDEHMGVIYEISRLPGSMQSSLNESQKEWIDSRATYYASRLRDLESRLRSGQSPTAGDRDLIAKFENNGGTRAIYGASERVRTQRGMRERFKRGLEISGRYDQAFRDIMHQRGVPEDLAYLPHVESSFQTNARSTAGACGVWQFMPATGKQYMSVNNSVDERFDPILAADGAARYLSQAHRKLGNWPLAITSYNHGQGGIAKARAQCGNDIGRIVKTYKGQYFGFASRNYYAEFMAAREVARNVQRYFPEGVNYESPWPYDRLVLQCSMPASHIAQHYGTSTDRLAALNLHLRDSALSGRSALPSGSTIWLPEGVTRRLGPPPPPSLLASSETASSQLLNAARSAVARVSDSTLPTKTPVSPDAGKARYHVVKPQETLYRVAVENGLSVEELRRLNNMSTGNDHIQPGQRLKVGT